MRLSEPFSPRYAGLRRRVPLYLGCLAAIAFGFVNEATVQALAARAGGRNPYVAVVHQWLFLLVLLEAAAAATVAVFLVSRWRAWSSKGAAIGAMLGAIPELTFPLLALAGALRQPGGPAALVAPVVDTLSLPGRGLAILLGYAPTGRWAVGLADPPTAWVARCWSLVVAGDVLIYGLAAALVTALLARRRGARGEPHNKSLKRTRFARRLAQVR